MAASFVATGVIWGDELMFVSLSELGLVSGELVTTYTTFTGTLSAGAATIPVMSALFSLSSKSRKLNLLVYI